MTASTAKSSQVSGFDSVPVTLSVSGKSGGEKRCYMETYEVATTSIDEADDIVKLVRIPSRLRITSVKIWNDDMDSHATPTLAVDVGLYNSKTGSVVDADAFASAITTLQAAAANTEILTEAMNIDKISKTAWEMGGLSSDPGVPLDVAFTVTTAAATAAAGTISIIVEGVLDA